MNAYELAEKAEGLAYEIPADWSSGEPKNVATDIAAMLRQQADRIAELEKQGKPVAWMQMHYKDNVPTKFSPVKVWEDDIPLYTTPQTKPLSDEEHYKNKAEYLEKRELELLAEIARLEKDLHMVQRHYDQLNLPDGYVVVCVHCAKELKIEFDESTDLEAKMTKYEQVLQSIANEQVELSHDKIKWQCEDHIRWAKEALK